MRAGWLVVGGSADEDDPVVLSRLVLSIETHAVLLEADRSPAGDEKRHLPDLAALVAAATTYRPELMVVLAGGAATYESMFAQADAQSGRAAKDEPSVAIAESEPADDAPPPTTDKAAAQTKMLSRKADEPVEAPGADESTMAAAPAGETEAEEAGEGETEAEEAGETEGEGEGEGETEGEGEGEDRGRGRRRNRDRGARHVPGRGDGSRHHRSSRARASTCAGRLPCHGGPRRFDPRPAGP